LVLPFILAVCFCGVFCLIPLGLYLWWLSLVTRREHPKPIAGAWDFAALLLGLSGFVVFGGGLVLTLFQSNFRYWMRGNAEALRGAWVQERVTWMLLVACYLFVVAAVAGLTLAARRRSVVVYNVEPAAFEALIGEVFDQMGRPVTRQGKVWSNGAPLFELDTFEGGRTVTLRWVSADGTLFDEVDRQLRAALATQSTGDNPAGRWLTAAAVGVATTAACSFGLLMYGLSLMR
jgi:hypothetical protein